MTSWSFPQILSHALLFPCDSIWSCECDFSYQDDLVREMKHDTGLWSKLCKWIFSRIIIFEGFFVFLAGSSSITCIVKAGLLCPWWKMKNQMSDLNLVFSFCKKVVYNLKCRYSWYCWLWDKQGVFKWSIYLDGCETDELCIWIGFKWKFSLMYLDNIMNFYIYIYIHKCWDFIKHS